MTVITSLLFWICAALWAVTSLGALVLPRLDLPGLDSVGWLADLALGWGNTQTGAAMALLAASVICAVARRPVLALLGLLLVPLCLCLAAASLDPRVPGLLPERFAGAYNALRGNLPSIRLGGFLGLTLAGSAWLFARRCSRVDLWLARIVAGLVPVLLLLAAMTREISALSLLMLPGLVLLLMLSLQMAEEERPGGAHAITGLVALIVGLGLVLADAGQRVDLRPAFVALPLLMLAVHRRRPAIRASLLWVHAGALLLLMAYLAPGLAPVFDQFDAGPTPTNLTEIRAALARATALRTGAGLALAILTLGGLLLVRLRRRDRHLPPEARAESASASQAA